MNNRVKISITGKNPTYFLDELIKRNINIYKVVKAPRELQVIIDISDLEEIEKIKTTYKIKIIERYGLNKYYFLLKKYFIFLIFIITGILLDITLSNMIFDIEVVHSNKDLVKTVTKDLNNFGLKKYHFKISYNKKEKIKEKLLAKEKDLLEWVEIEESGTKYIVKVEQRKKNKKENKCNDRNIVAKKNAIVMEIQATTGEIVKKKNDYVVKGETLISGLIHNKEDIVSKKCAIGKVYGEVWYNVLVSIPLKYEAEKITSTKKHGISLKYFTKEYNLLNNFQTFKKDEYNIVSSKILPINISLAKYIKTEKISKKYNFNNVNKIAISNATKEINKHLQEDEKIISKKVLKKTQINSKIKVEVFFKVREDITDYRDISDLDIEELSKKEE